LAALRTAGRNCVNEGKPVASLGSSGSTRATRALGNALRAYRGKVRLHVVGEAVGLSPAQVNRIESGTRKCSEAVLAQLVEYYQLSADENQQVLELAVQVWEAEPPWWDVYSDTLTAAYRDLIEREAHAHRRRDYQPMLIPALMQSERYSRAVTADGFASIGEDQVDDLVAVRVMRQRRVHEEKPPLVVETVLTEAALRFHVGGVDVQREQLEHLLKMAELPQVCLRVLPFSAGARGVQPSSYTLLDYESPESEPSVAFVQSVTGSELKTDARTIKRLNRLFGQMTDAALSPEDSCALIAHIKQEVERE